MKTVKQIGDEQYKAAENLPTETKKKFWEAMLNGKNVGEARAIAGIDDIGVAAQLVIQSHKTLTIPMRIDEIK